MIRCSIMSLEKEKEEENESQELFPAVVSVRFLEYVAQSACRVVMVLSSPMMLLIIQDRGREFQVSAWR